MRIWIKESGEPNFRPERLGTDQAIWVTGSYLNDTLRLLLPRLPEGRRVCVGWGAMDRAEVPPGAIVIHRGDEHAMPLFPLPPTAVVFKEYGVRQGGAALRYGWCTGGLVEVGQDTALDLLACLRSKRGASVGTTWPIPIGYSTPVELEGEPGEPADRPIDIGFAGSIRHSTERRMRDLLGTPKERARQRLLSALDRLAADGDVRVAVRPTQGFGDPGDGRAAYAWLLRSAKIAVCPRGTSRETFRHFEAAMAGCVVVSEPLPKHWFYADAPFVYLRNWSDLGHIVHDLLRDPDRLWDTARKTRQWWSIRCSPGALADWMERHINDKGRP